MDRGDRGVPPFLIDTSSLTEQYPDEVEADLQRYYQMELSSLWTGDLSWRRLGVLVRHLPAESATKTALRNAAPVEELKASVSDAEYGAWSQTDMLLADLIDVARWLQWSKTKDAAAEPPRNAPNPYPRPGVERATPSGGVSANVIDLLEYVRKSNGAAPDGWGKV